MEIADQVVTGGRSPVRSLWLSASSLLVTVDTLQDGRPDEPATSLAGDVREKPGHRDPASGLRPLGSAASRGSSTQSGRRGPQRPRQHRVLASRQGPGVEGEASRAGRWRGHFAPPGEVTPIRRAPGDSALLGHGASMSLPSSACRLMTLPSWGSPTCGSRQSRQVLPSPLWASCRHRSRGPGPVLT